MNTWTVRISYSKTTAHVAVRARSHEEAEREALHVLQLDYPDVDDVTVSPRNRAGETSEQ